MGIYIVFIAIGVVATAVWLLFDVEDIAKEAFDS